VATKLYVGGLAYSVDDEELRDLFAAFGNIESAQVIIDRQTNRSKGFGFVEMSEADAKTAIEELNGKDFSGRTITVNEARPFEKRPPRPAGGGMGGSRGRDQNNRRQNNQRRY
jgi:RNA recognition motif-containing protein